MDKLAVGLDKSNIMDGKDVVNLMRNLWISRDEKLTSAQLTQVPIDYAESYPHQNLREINGLTTFCHRLRLYNNKKQQPLYLEEYRNTRNQIWN